MKPKVFAEYYALNGASIAASTDPVPRPAKVVVQAEKMTFSLAGSSRT